MQARWRLMAATLTAVLVAGCGSAAADIPGPVHHVSMKLTESSANFGLTLLDKLLTQSDAGNVFISPLSATIMLSMAASAAEGDTRAKMLTALGLDPSVDPSGELRQTIQRLNQSDANAQLELAQAVWVQNGLKLNAAYEAKLGNDYQSQLANLNFNDPKAPDVVNRWVDSNTHHKIPKLVDRFEPGTVGYLANATYFHALWATAFDSMTQPIEFHTFEGQTRPLPAMERKETVTAFFTADYGAVLLPYKGGRFSAVMILPAHLLSPAAFAGFLTEKLWTEVLDKFHADLGPLFVDKCKGDGCGLTLDMPKFTIDYKADLTQTLASMGFAIPGAVPQFCDGCFLSDVVQATHLEVDEKGTTAAAVTGGTVILSGRVHVLVDRPFAFAIIDNATDAPLFLGAIGNLG